MEQFVVGKDKILQVKLFRSKVYIDIRVWEEGVTKVPTIIGITLSRDEWRKLKAVVPDVQSLLVSLSKGECRGGSVFLGKWKLLQVKSYEEECFVDIRKYDKVPLEVGITLTEHEFETLCDKLKMWMRQ
jgi:hypothetical protein